MCYPKLPSCEDCKQYRYDEDWNQKKRRRGRIGLQVIEEPERRSAGEIPPCSKCPKILPGVAPLPENAVVLSTENESAFFYFRLCQQDPLEKQYPRDSLTRENNALIQSRIEAIDRQRAADTNEILLVMNRVSP